VASKMEEIVPPSVVDLCDFSSDIFRREQMLEMEQVLVKVIILTYSRLFGGDCGLLLLSSGST